MMSKPEAALPYADLADVLLPLLERKSLQDRQQILNYLFQPPYLFTVMATNRFRRFIFNSDQSRSNVEVVFFSLPLFY